MTESSTDPPSSEKITIVMATRPGVMRQSLRATLALSSRNKIVGSAGGGLSALELARTHQPAILVIDSGLVEDEMLALLRQIKQEQPHIRCLVLAETIRQQQVMQVAGADAVLLHGEPVERILDVLAEFNL